ncbi:MAG TPA: hypothetical protein VG649_06040 [Candidatus Angelobacter sp.]|nr:hypothetical protein [Candidatus Angelobacter sp.]
MTPKRSRGRQRVLLFLSRPNGEIGSDLGRGQAVSMKVPESRAGKQVLRASQVTANELADTVKQGSTVRRL